MSKFTRIERILAKKGQKFFILVSHPNSGRIWEINFIRGIDKFNHSSFTNFNAMMTSIEFDDIRGAESQF